MNADRTPGLPVELRLVGRRVVLLGPGAAARSAALTECGASVDARSDDLVGASLVMLTGPVDATPQALDELRAACQAVGTLLWIEDAPDRSDITFPALLSAGPVRIAVSTGGRSSALARAVRDALRPLLGADFVAWADRALADGRRRPKGRFTGGFEPGPRED